MSDITRFILDRGAGEDDPAGHLIGLEEWNERIAMERAAEEGLRLTDDHWAVLRFLREHYRRHGPGAHARRITQALEERFARHGGREHLQRLFPQGPVRQASRIAGLPAPANVASPSFDSSK
jgi:tRNA 2-thiouridine synthesizing protein E